MTMWNDSNSWLQVYMAGTFSLSEATIESPLPDDTHAHRTAVDAVAARHGSAGRWPFCPPPREVLPKLWGQAWRSGPPGQPGCWARYGRGSGLRHQPREPMPVISYFDTCGQFDLFQHSEAPVQNWCSVRLRGVQFHLVTTPQFFRKGIGPSLTAIPPSLVQEVNGEWLRSESCDEWCPVVFVRVLLCDY